MQWWDWLRLAGEIIAIIVAWFASRKHTNSLAARNVRSILQDVYPSVNPDLASLAITHPSRASRSVSQRRSKL